MAAFEYPAHIDRSSLDALPCKPGVYFFRNRHGESVYIGKSVNIRARVLSHLRTPEEAEMLRETCTVDFVRTAGEIGALLLESKLIKQMQPAYNVLLRSIGEMFSIRLDADDTHPKIVGSAESEFGGCLYGLYASRNEAQHGFSELIRRHRLCPVLIGIETATRGRACFAHQIGRCLGACIGIESPQSHQARLRKALEQVQASVWPYAGAIGIFEECDGLRQVHVIDHWSHVVTLQGRRTRFRRPARLVTDIDVYKILARPLSEGILEIMPMEAQEAEPRRGRIS